MRAIRAVVVVAASLIGWLACSSNNDGCKLGDVRGCTCDDKGTTERGTQACGAGHVWAACKCAAIQPNQPAGSPTTTPVDDGGTDGAPPAQNPAKPRGPSGLVAIAAGAFTMGCSGSLDVGCQDDSKPTHDVTLTAFSIDMTEVTQTEYDACVKTGACKAPGTSATCAWDPATRADFPVTCISWADANAYCASVGKRLPTEAEWERAARGGGTPATGEHTLYPWGDGPLSLDCAHSNFYGVRGCTLPATDVVGTRPDGASPEGALDMSGNVWEWVEDFYQSNYYASSPTSDPHGPAGGSAHVVRGGGYRSGTNSLETTFRFSFGGPDPQVGFRCAK